MMRGRRLREEVADCDENPWQADTYFECEQYRIVIELQRSYPHCGPSPFLKPEIPRAFISAKMLHAPLKDWLASIMNRRFRWNDGVWLIESTTS
jgi:hypothetical protein